MSNTFGRLFRVTTFGESHGPCVGAVVDGCPAQIEISEREIQAQLDRRRPGQSRLTSPRQEADRVRILSGVENGLTLGSPIALMVENIDAQPADYSATRDIPRPSHADFVYHKKYGIVAASGGGRASARETVGRVAAGAIAEKLLASRYGVRIVAWVSSAGNVDCPDITEREDIARKAVDSSEIRCPVPEVASRMGEAVRAAANAGDSLGGIVTCVCRNVPVGWGEPVFGKAGALLGAGMLSIPAAKGFEVGSGFAGTRMKGSEHNDAFVRKGAGLGTSTNRSGGIQGGITNGEPIVFRVAFKPTATVRVPQATVDYAGNPVVLNLEGRHDPCVLPRAVAVVEAMAALVLADLALLARSSGVVSSRSA